MRGSPRRTLMARHRTPLRYPGGKQRLAPFINEVLVANDADRWNYVEAYAGGAGVGMELLLEDRVKRVHLNDCSRPIYAFWRAILDHPEAFCRRISRAALTLDAWRKHRDVVRAQAEHDVLDLGFSTFFLNRCNRSGVLTGGVIGGLQQQGEWLIDARFPRQELIRRIETIATRAHRVTVTNLDAEVFLSTKVAKMPAQTLVYCDPPYFSRAKRLYLDTYDTTDHARLATAIQKVKQPWMVSYDSHPTIAALYQRRRRFTYRLSYSAISAYAGRELFIFSDRLKIPETSVLDFVAEGLKRLA